MQNDILEQEQILCDSIKKLESINKKIAKLTATKEELTSEIIGCLEHDHEGQKSYEFNVWKIEIKTPIVYSLDKKAYERGDFFVPDGFNPIKQSVSYSVDKRLCEQYMNEAPKKVREVLSQLITKKPGKKSVSIKERV